MADMALSVVQPLLWLIRSEAQLLRGVSGDVQFIKDEMESMKGFLLNLARINKVAAGGDYQLRAWMEQVMELAYDSRNCIEDYAQSGRPPGRDRKGLAGRFLRVVWLPKRLLVRRRIAKRFRGVKVRVKEIGQRQQRYAVSVPSRTDAAPTGITVDWVPQAGHRAQERPTHPARDSPRWAILAGPDILTQAKLEVLKWLEARSEQNHTWSWLKTNTILVLGVVTLDGVVGASLADQVYQYCRGSSAAGPLNFDYMVNITIQRPPLLEVILLDMLRQLCSEEYFSSMGTSTAVEKWDDKLTKELRKCLRGKRLLLLLSDMDYPKIWAYINKRLETFQCSAGSVVVFCTNDPEVVVKCNLSEKKVYSLVDFCSKKAVALAPTKFDLDEDRRFHLLAKTILGQCTPDFYCMNLFLHALLSNPNRTEQELESLSGSLDPGRCATAIERQSLMLTFCYRGLHKDYQNCLWYSVAFNRGIFKVRKASLLRRWVAEGLIKRADHSSVMAEAERCFDALFTQKLLLPREVGGTGNIKSCGPNALLSPMLTDATTDEAFLDANHLPEDLQLHFSIRNGIQLRRITESASTAVDSIMSPHRNNRMEKQMTSMMAFLKYLPTSSSFRLLRVLELEGYQGFRKCHLKNICKIHQLKYLSLRNTDVKQLPEEIRQLLLLETLDIRGTRVKELNTVLPKLKHLLAGCISFGSQEATVKSKESFSTIRLHHGATEMTNLEVLSHVKVSNNAKELRGAAMKLPMLKKLGVVLSGKKHTNLDNIFSEIRQFDRCFGSLSIRAEQRGSLGSAPAAVLPLPSYLKSLRICGIVGWLPSSIRDLNQLTKITLRETSLSEDALPILGALESLVCLRLLYHSLVEVAPVFEAGKFGSLMDLVVEDDTIRSITFAPGTSPKLGKMVWSFNHMNSLSGVQNLPSLRYLELNRGTYESDGLRDLRRDIPNHVNFCFNPPEEGQH
ncbi:hypothetical protein BAE44_0017710 [Dichanthelium oligosanthes]|uniref:Uncharacterized protein n=1 Tax=Dichanthelium oligosanthes TaxID=888268 RepID=A0A1E5V7Y2_9POAL|nr:hypothetical protein BAE44_0017710 [Dichanthelium oligosanthes]